MSDATMNTGDVSRRLGLPVTADFLLSLGFKPIGKDKRATLWDQDDYPQMCEQTAQYLRTRKGIPMQDKPEKPGKPDKAPKSAPPPADDDDEL